MATVAETNGAAPLINGDLTEMSSSQGSSMGTGTENGLSNSSDVAATQSNNHAHQLNGEEANNNEFGVGVPREEISGGTDMDNVPWGDRIRARSGTIGKREEKKKTESEQTPKKESISKSRKRKESSEEEKDIDENSEDEEEEYQPKIKLKKLDTPSSSVKKTGKKSSTKTTTIVKEEVKVENNAGMEHTKRKKTKVEVKEEPSSSQGSPSKKRVKKQEEEEEVWRWWEEDESNAGASDGSIKWQTLVHKGPVFAPAYEPLPKHIKFKYEGKEKDLSLPAEEVASFYAKMLDHDYTSKPVFNQNFFKDWRKVMTSAERVEIKELAKCDFKQLHAYYVTESEKRKARSKEEKKAEKETKEAEAKVYGFAMLDGYKQKIGNFRIEPPGLFRGRGDHPKMGSLKKRVQPEDVVINCSKGLKIMPPEGHKWKEIRHDNTVTWLCSWTENVLGSNKYIMLNPSSKLKGQKDWDKFEKARKLKGHVGQIREQYLNDFKSKEMRVRQRAVALYFIDKLALRAGNEKDTDEAADTVGCCSLRCEHIKLHDEMDDQKFVVEFDFLGKDSIRYYNRVPVEKQVFKNLRLFMEEKDPGDDLFDRLDTSSLNQYLKELMDGLTAKVFRTYNASITLQEQLDKLTNPSDSVHEKLLSYNRANRQVAILCNHQRAVPKTHEKSMENLENKIKEKKKEYKELKDQLKKSKSVDEKLAKKYERLKEQIAKLNTQRTDKNKQIALGTSKLNYLDPRISVAWCKKYDVAIEKIFSKTQRDKFRWAIDMAKEDYVF
uniref:DNA topoisomerase I n=1 Tax=Globodera rostochiensis TaxID=31243 RepID=A0A914IB77_GLORO